MLIGQFLRSIFVCMLVAVFPLSAQKWEFGAGAGGSFYMDKTIDSTRGTAEAGFKPGVAGTAWLGNMISPHVGGEIRYTFQTGNARLTSGGGSVDLPVRTHQVHYDVMIYATSPEARVRPFVAFGGGIKGFQGRGQGQAFQPLLQFAALTPTMEWLPVVSAGGGIKWRVSDAISVRAEVRDFLSPFPKKVILPTPPNKISGWLNNFVVMFGIGYHF
jgi:hypothetical protein